MRDENKEQRTADSPPHSDERGVNPKGEGPAQPKPDREDEPGAAHAGATARADEDTYD